MAIRNVPQKAGRIRGHEEALREQTGSRNPPRVIAPRPDAAGRFRFKSPEGFAEGRTTRIASLATLRRNRGSARRKPAARRTNPLKKLMRKQTIGPQVAAVMRTRRDKGDRRRSQAERIARREALGKIRPGLRRR